MFTGIIQEIGSIQSVDRQEQSTEIRVLATKMLEGLSIGHSIAVNGACLTVTAFDGQSFTVEAVAETIRQTNLGSLSTGDRVNLEAALRLNDRMGGHWVMGHIDSTAIISKMQREGRAMWIWLEMPAHLMRYMIKKGSVAVDGVSLTIAELNQNRVGLSIIPGTAQHTTLLEKQAGQTVNIEVDVLGKYIENFLIPGHQQLKRSSNIDMDFLARNGYK